MNIRGLPTLCARVHARARASASTVSLRFGARVELVLVLDSDAHTQT